ncbi:hypothetical protein PY092_06685 [Muricauda sp. 334s03]|uniref:DUF7477 domain-containing protein n=1 Tax=Flagellimonas yonaguniensis TaxID=3031325 RepID=A0ABT5XYC7_9FLAO|nr:hypothetical protein [[Muricauda] yonaguniensis]MDF0715827.1 hypothetical protein [[Muricauda] yonaguniensis]
MKHFLVSLLILCAAISGYSQSYYETSWVSGDVKYTALVIFYEKSEALVRVKYYANGSDKLASYACTYKNFTKSDGTSDNYLDGSDAYIVRGPSNSSYSADNFYFHVKENGTSYEAYTADDNAFDGGDFTQSMKPMLYWVELNPTAMTKGYLDDYFEEDESLFQLLVYLNKGEISYPTENNAVTVLANGVDGESVWAAVMDNTSKAPYSEQKIKKSHEFPSEWIKQQWDEGLNISAFDYDESKNQFVVLMSKGNALQPQSWKKSDTFPNDWVSEKWKEGYYITSMTNGNGNWYLAMNKNTGYQNQKWKTSQDIPRDWIIDNWNENHAITSATYGNGLWALTMTRGSTLGAQSWKTETAYPFDWIKERADKGYSITTITYGDGMWLVVMSKNTTNTTNRSSSQYRDIPINWILQNTSDY